MFNIAVPCNNNTKLPSNQTCAHIRFWSGDVLMLESVLYDGCYALFVLDFILLEKLS